MGMYDMIGFDPKQSGWIPPEERSPDVAAACNAIVEDTPVLACSGPAFERPKWSVAWADEHRVAGVENWRRNGHMKNLRQLTGSCVGFGATTMAFWSSVTDALWFGDPTRVIFPFFGYHYGLGRLESGIRGRGEGSSGAGQARALEKYGYLAFDHAGVPQPTIEEVIRWTEEIEYEWSNGAGPAQQFIADGQKHRFERVTLATSVDQAIDLMASRYWGTQASNWGGVMGPATVRGDGNGRVLVMPRREVWNHQMSVLGFWFHPTLGLLIAIGNQWAYLHGADPERVEDESTPPAAPPGVFWVAKADFQYMLGFRETFFFAGTPNFDVRPGKYRMV